MDFVNDWRNRGQIDYLKNVTLEYMDSYVPQITGEHEHCEFCFEKISELSSGQNGVFCTLDKRYWICNECYEELKLIFKWNII